MPLVYQPGAMGPAPTPEPHPRPRPTPAAQSWGLVISRGGEALEFPASLTWEGPWIITPGVYGLDMPEVQVTRSRAAGMWGGHSSDIDVPSREVFLPLALIAGDLQTMLDERDRFDRLTSPLTLDPVRLTATRPDGTTRWVEGHTSVDSPRPWTSAEYLSTIGQLRFGWTLICDDPWWHGEQDPISWSSEEGRGGFFPLLPVKLRSGRVLAQPTPVFVRGDAPMWPRWSISGPAESVTATHVESGRSWTLHGQFGQSVTPIIVDTDPRVAMTTGLQVATPGGSQRWSWMQPPFDLWPLPPGDQTVTLEIVGASPTTQVTMTPRPNYLAA